MFIQTNEKTEETESLTLRIKIRFIGLGSTYYICSKIRLSENVFPLTPTLTLKHNNVFGLTN